MALGRYSYHLFVDAHCSGLVLVGPALHVWYGVLGHLFSSGTTYAALGQLALDQLLFGPLFVGFFMSALLTLVCLVRHCRPLENFWYAQGRRASE